jgi:succinyl-CoA synthetase alpha subunit
MAILVDENSRVVVQGLTGREGSFHALRNRAYGTQVVAGVAPGKSGNDVSGISVFDTVAEAIAETAADVSLIFVPAHVAADAIYEAVDAGIKLVVCITEGIPVYDVLDLYHWVREQGAVLIGPNGSGLISPGKAAVGIMPVDVFCAGPIGIISRSGALTYEIAHALTGADLGQSTAVDIGGDTIPGSGFVEMLARFEEDDETEAVVLVGSIRGSEEELAAEFVRDRVSKPVVAYVAGFTAPPDNKMGYERATISADLGTAQAKAEALQGAGVAVARAPGEVPDIVQAALASRWSSGAISRRTKFAELTWADIRGFTSEAGL